MEEEKFRRNGKKKYEALAEKLLALHQRLVSLVSSGPASSSAASNQPWQSLELRLGVQSLSTATQALLQQGAVSREKLELMRLHTLPTSVSTTSVSASGESEVLSPVAVVSKVAPRVAVSSSAVSTKENTRPNALQTKTKSNESLIAKARINSGSNGVAAIKSGSSTAPKTTGFVPVGENPLLPASSTSSATCTATSHGHSGSGAGRRYSFLPPTPPSSHDSSSLSDVNNLSTKSNMIGDIMVDDAGDLNPSSSASNLCVEH